MNQMFRPSSRMAEHPLEALAGTVERVTFHNAENGFCVLKVQARGKRDLVAVVGHAPAIGAGEWITASGAWVSDRTHGLQFKAEVLKTTPPTGAEGIEKYLASGQMRGIGPAMAKRIVASLRRGHLRDHRGQPGAPDGGLRHRPVAGRADRRGLGRAEGGAGDHDLPARPWGRHGASRSHLQDLRPRGHQGHDRGPVPARPRRSRHRLPHGRRDCEPSSAWRRPPPSGSGRACPSPSRPRRTRVTVPCRSRCWPHAGAEAPGGRCRPDRGCHRGGTPARRGGHQRHGRAQETCVFLKGLHAAERAIAERLIARAEGSPPWPAIDLDKALPWVEGRTGKTLSAVPARGRAAGALLAASR